MQRVWSVYLEGGQPGVMVPIQPQSPDQSRRNSLANSVYSQANSSRHMLAPPETPTSASPFMPPSFPLGNDSSSNLSLTINYLPAKFSSSMLSPGGMRRRKGNHHLDLAFPKRGGGVDAFRSGATRIPGREDEDEWVNASRGRKMKWNRFKWILFVANVCLSFYSLMSLIFCLLTWFNMFTHSDILRVANRPELIISTIAAVSGILTSLIGWAGILLNNRAFLAIYAVMCWLTFAWLLVPGYITYRKRTFNLEGKLNAQWSRQLGAEGRLRIQNVLGCCGYFSPFIEATITSSCYARSMLPGCKLGFLHYQRLVLGRWFAAAFGLVPIQIFVTISALLCSNHVTYRFGKGMMPTAYQLTEKSMAIIMQNYADQIADQYGEDVAKDVISRSPRNSNASSVFHGQNSNPFNP